ncbi:MAG: hypothetical protein LW857_05920 [Verrucomicrobiae bacterium]|nr:hypothetical protein [Verrucomicrobiae bacterium]
MKPSSLFLLLAAASVSSVAHAEDKAAPKAPAKAVAAAKAKEADANEPRVKAMMWLCSSTRPSRRFRRSVRSR